MGLEITQIKNAELIKAATQADQEAESATAKNGVLDESELSLFEQKVKNAIEKDETAKQEFSEILGLVKSQQPQPAQAAQAAQAAQRTQRSPQPKPNRQTQQAHQTQQKKPVPGENKCNKQSSPLFSKKWEKIICGIVSGVETAVFGVLPTVFWYGVTESPKTFRNGLIISGIAGILVGLGVAGVFDEEK